MIIVVVVVVKSADAGVVHGGCGNIYLEDDGSVLLTDYLYMGTFGVR